MSRSMWRRLYCFQGGRICVHYCSQHETQGHCLPEICDISEVIIRRILQHRRCSGFCIIMLSRVMYFCSAGKDRTGVVSAVLLKRLGYSNPKVLYCFAILALHWINIVENYGFRTDIPMCQIFIYTVDGWFPHMIFV